MRKFTIGSLLVALTAVFAAQAPAHHKPGHTQVRQNQQKTWVCHRTGSGWRAIRPSSRAAMRGHMRHGDMPAMVTPTQPAMTREQARAACAVLPTPTRGGTVLTGNLPGTTTTLVTLRLRANVVCFQFTLPTGFTFGAAHIHSGATTGPIVVPLTSSGQTSGCVKTTGRMVRDILASPSGFVVNWHQPGTGAIILSTGPLTAST